MGWHTAGINVFGSFVLGGIFATPVSATKAVESSTNLPNPNSLVRGGGSTSATTLFGITPRTKLLAGVGFCGSFTTFSTFSVDIVNMLGRGEMSKASSYFLLNNTVWYRRFLCWFSSLSLKKIYKSRKNLTVIKIVE